MKFETAGVLDSPSSKEKMPEVSSDNIPRKNQPHDILICAEVNCSNWNKLKRKFLSG
jgi:hypothetical protein